MDKESDEPSNLKLITNVTLSILEKALIDVKEDLPTLLEYQEINARLTRCKYNSLMDQGFTAEQALELSKTL